MSKTPVSSAVPTRLWRRQSGWHEAAARLKPDSGVSASPKTLGTGPSPIVELDDINAALACATAASCNVSSSARAQPTCHSCGYALASSAPDQATSAVTVCRPCWACCWSCTDGWPHVLTLVLRLPVVSSGGLGARDRVAVAACCRAWRSAVFLSRMPPRLATRHAGRKWLQGWYGTFHRCIQGVPAAVASGCRRHAEAGSSDSAAVGSSRIEVSRDASSTGAATLPCAGSREQLTKANVMIAEDDAEAGKQLFRDLKEVCATGVAPDFSDLGALNYYTLQVSYQTRVTANTDASVLKYN